MAQRPSLMKSVMAAAAAGDAPPIAAAASEAPDGAPSAPAPPASPRRPSKGAGQVRPPEKGTAKARVGKTMLAGYFSAEAARSVRILAAERGVTVQALIGEGLDLLLRKYGKHPFEER